MRISKNGEKFWTRSTRYNFVNYSVFNLYSIVQECLKNESLLKLIGFKENIVESEDEPAKDCIEPKVVQSHALSIKSQKLANIVPFKVELTVKSNSDEHEDHDYKCITDFEDSTLHEEKLDLGKLKRKY